MIDAICSILKENVLSIYLYGSSVLDDFKLGWSDIDILVLTKEKIDLQQANQLVPLRQQLLESQPDNKYFRKFEGAMLSFDAFANQKTDTVVYWGTRGEKIKDSYCLDSFSMKQLLDDGKLLFGEDVRNQLTPPMKQDLYNDVVHHYHTIREHGQQGDRNLYTFGWFLDISRCIYTLRTGKIISKTQAGYWAIENKVCPNEAVMKTVLMIRENPSKYKAMPEIMDYAETLGTEVKRYADVLERELGKVK